MGPPMDDERLQRMMSDPNVQQSMNEALSNPDFVNMLIESNPMLRNMPNAREIITSPFMRQMMGNPQMLSQAMRMQRNMRGGDSAFPAPGATDTTPDAAASTGNAAGGNNANQGQDPFMSSLFNPFAGGDAQPDMGAFFRNLSAAGANPFAPPAGNQATTGDGAAAGTAASTGNTQSEGGNAAAGTGQGQQPPNPFASLFPPSGGTQGNPFNLNPEMMQQMMGMLGGGGAANPASPPDNRPPEERYADQLRQLNDMGFYDFDRNVAALRRTGGSVQGAIEYLLGGN